MKNKKTAAKKQAKGQTKKQKAEKARRHHGDASFTPIYLVIILIIAGIILFKVVKPLLAQQYEGSVARTGQAVEIAKGGFLGLSIIIQRLFKK